MAFKNFNQKSLTNADTDGDAVVTAIVLSLLSYSRAKTTTKQMC